MARTAVVAGTATAVVGGVSRTRPTRPRPSRRRPPTRPSRPRRRRSRWCTPPRRHLPAEGLTEDTLDQLKQLGELHNSGVLTDEEFAAQKAKILGS